MTASFRPPPPCASPAGLFECLRVLAEEARAIGLDEAARTILLAADFVAIEAEEHGLSVRDSPRRPRDARVG
ncbi:hypothetical protein [Elioraea rosea]|uniref:hypothetical protein n=1 Tax=Elioraea rosea TaxID=2492390 RepID=UPI0011860A26|nr:hypothetical protein [Elioraea rosea]